jgi:hypothetical protein
MPGVLPFVNAQRVERRNRPDASVVQHDVQLTVAFASQFDKSSQIAAPSEIYDHMNGGATCAGFDDTRSDVEAEVGGRACSDLVEDCASFKTNPGEVRLGTGRGSFAA